MNNMQLYLTIGIPTLTVILAWVSSRSETNRLNDKMDKLADTLRGEMKELTAVLRGEMKDLRTSLHGELNDLGGSMRGEMITFRREVHSDLILLHERVVKVETRQGS